jgi:outer membrane protein assembly factor BamA
MHAMLRPQLDGAGTLALAVQEGRPERIAALHLRGTSAMPEPVVRDVLGLGAGDPFRPPEVEVQLATLADEYARRGYLDAEATLERLEFGDAGVVLGVVVTEGAPAVLGEVTVRGNTTTRARLVEQLAGLRTPEPADLRRLRDAPRLLRRSGLFADVAEPVLYRSGARDQVGVVLRVVESRHRHRAFGAVGVSRDPVKDRAVLSGSLDLRFSNIFGTGRDLGVAWRRDALLGSHLALDARERYPFGWPLELQLAVVQRVRDSTYTAQSLDAGASLPLNRTLALEVGGAVDRSVYHLGLAGTTLRGRLRTGLRFTSLAREEDRTRWGTLEVRAEWARRRDELRGTGTTVGGSARQTLWSGSYEVGQPLGRRWSVAMRGAWAATDGAATRASEQFEFGGARTLRGSREGQFRGDQVAWTQLELRHGDPRAAQLYAFFDAGALRRHPENAPLVEETHTGFGAGLRAQAGTGALDLAFGVGEERDLADVKVHVALLQRF